MRARTRFVVALGLVLATAGVSTAVAARQERSTDEQVQKAALDAVRLSIVRPDDPSFPFDPQVPDGKAFSFPVRNDSASPVLLRRTTWRGDLSRVVDQVVVAGEAVLVQATQPTACPDRRTEEPVTTVDVEVARAGGTRTIRLTLPDPLQASRELNQRCGLFRARESASASIIPVRIHPREVTLDVAFELNGPRPTQLLAVRATEGVTATVTEKLPLAVPPGPTTFDGTRKIPHTFTVVLRLTDCAGPRSSQEAEDPGEGEYRRAPMFNGLQLTVQRPGDAVEKVNLGFGAEPANALVAGCGLPPLLDAIS